MEKAAAQSDELAIKALPKIRKEAEENMDAVKAPSTLFHLTVPDRPKAPATPPVHERYRHQQDDISHLGFS